MTQITCPHCHKPVSSSDKNCPRCGATILSLDGIMLEEGNYVEKEGSIPVSARYERSPAYPRDNSNEQVQLLRSINSSLLFFKVLTIIALVAGGIIGLIAAVGGLPG